MTETAETIRSKNVDGGVEAVLLDLVKRLEAMEKRPMAHPDEYALRWGTGADRIEIVYLPEPSDGEG